MVHNMYQLSVVEPIAADAGPNLIGLSNLQRWDLSFHPTNGLVPVEVEKMMVVEEAQIATYKVTAFMASLP
jgi:hypothetical protein